MTEKTFRDRLPLTDKQREFLRHPRDKFYRCGSCPLWNSDDPRNSVCTSTVFPIGFMCHEKRAEALRLDDEYRKANIKKEILSQQEFELKMKYSGYACHTSVQCIKSHAAALERIAELETQLDVALKAQNGSAEYAKEKVNENLVLKNRIAELESRLAAYGPVKMDTREGAEEKTISAAREALSNNMDIEILNGRNEITISESGGGNYGKTNFPYTEQVNSAASRSK